MAAETPMLLDVLADHISEAIIECGQLREGVGGPSTYEAIRRNAAAAERAWREACTITTIEQLNALPIGAMVMTLWDPEPHHTMTRFSDGWYGWPSRDKPLYPMGGGDGNAVLLLWHPGWAQP